VRLILTFAFAVILNWLGIVPSHAEKRVALVVGESAYRNVAMLPNPERDAASIAKLFKDAGFDTVVAANNVGNLEFKRAIRRFEDASADADLAVVFYAGHGIEIGGVNYLVPVDAILARDRDARDEAISLDRLIEAVEGAKRLRLIILDACRDNPFGQRMKRMIAVRSISPGLGKVEPTSSDTLIAYAAKAGSTAEDGEGTHSPFTTALLANLATPGLDVRLMFGRVRDQVMKMTSNRQEPFVYGSLGGNTVALVEEKNGAAQATLAADTSARGDYELAERIGTKEAWQTFVATHGNSFYQGLARAALDKLEAQQTKPASTVVAMAPANESSTKPEPRAADSGYVASLLQFHLKRVGCDPGTLNGTWNDQTSHAMAQFNRSAHTNFDVKVASLGALEAVKEHKARVCPLQCGKGQKAEDDRCVAEACKRGYVHNKEGECVRAAKTATAPARTVEDATKASMSIRGEGSIRRGETVDLTAPNGRKMTCTGGGSGQPRTCFWR
jgi:uncharacterized caspase-like protein